MALLLSPHSEPIVSEPSVVISTLAAGIPSSPPIIIRATAVDAKRISVSWKPGPFPNGPIHSYVLEIVGEFMALKEVGLALKPCCLRFISCFFFCNKIFILLAFFLLLLLSLFFFSSCAKSIFKSKVTDFLFLSRTFQQQKTRIFTCSKT